MIERRPLLDFLTHVVLILGVIVVAFPVYVVFVASSLTAEDVLQAPMTLIPGPHLIENYRTVLTSGIASMGSRDAANPPSSSSTSKPPITPPLYSTLSCTSRDSMSAEDLRLEREHA